MQLLRCSCYCFVSSCSGRPRQGKCSAVALRLKSGFNLAANTHFCTLYDYITVCSFTPDCRGAQLAPAPLQNQNLTLLFLLQGWGHLPALWGCCPPAGGGPLRTPLLPGLCIGGQACLPQLPQTLPDAVCVRPCQAGEQP